MDAGDFSHKLHAVMKQVAGFQKRSHLLPSEAQELVPELMEELLVSLEELCVADEELQQQTMEVAAVRDMAEVERQRYQDLFEFAPDAYLVTDKTGLIQQANRAAAQLLRRSQKYLVGKPLPIYVQLDARKAFRGRLAALSGVENMDNWETCVLPARDAPVDVSVTVTSTLDPVSKVITLRWLLRNISQRKQAEFTLKQAYDELEVKVGERTAELSIANAALQAEIYERQQAQAAERAQRVLAEAMIDITRAMTSSLNLSEVLDQILTNVGVVVPHDAADIMLVESDEVHIVRSYGYPVNGTADGLPAFQLGLDETPALRQMAESLNVLVISEPHDLPDWLKDTQEGWVHSYMGVPITWQSKLIGFLNLASKQTGFFRSEHAQPLRAFAAQAAIAIQNAQLYQQVQTLAALEERQRLARDLHDAVSQTLFTSSLIAETLLRLENQDADDFWVYLQQMYHLNRSALAEMRMLLLELRPEQIARLSFATQLRQLGDALKGRIKVEISLFIEDNHPLPMNVQFAMYRIAQEVFNNIVKHSRATMVNVTFVSKIDGVEFSVSDNGVGFDTINPASGLGMNTLRERAAAINAFLQMSSDKNVGTQVWVSWSPDHNS